MQFASARPDIVRAIQQRWLMNLWFRHRGADRLPKWQAVETEALAALSTQLSILDVSGRDGIARFRIRYHGELIGQVYGSADCRGKYLDETVPPFRLQEALAPYQRAAANACAVYTIHDLKDRAGRPVQFERLLLPFGRDGHHVDRILAAFEFISADGRYDADGLMTTQAASVSLRLSATIEVPAMA